MDSGISSFLGRKYPDLVSDDERFGKIVINDIPVLFGLSGEIICIPNRYEICSPIGVVAKKGKGKSLLLHRLCDEFRWNQEFNVCHMNDSLEETFSWSKQQNMLTWIGELSAIKEIPVPLPMVYVYPNTSSLNLKEEMGKDGKMCIPDKNVNYIKITIPFSEVLNNLNIYTKLEKSGNYLRNIINDLATCNSEEEVVDMIKEKIEVGKATQDVQNKIIAQFDNLFNENIINISVPECPSFISVDGNLENPFVALMKLGLVPAFVTSDLYQKEYKELVIAYHLNRIFDAQARIFKEKKTYLVFDELTKICSTEERNLATKALEQIAARGRMMNIGLMFATQNYEKIPQIIRSNTEYVFALRHSNKKEVNEIAKDFDLMGIDEEDLLNLEKFECIGITSEKWKIYYPNGLVEEKTGAVRGRIIPPLSRHAPPKQ